MDNEIIKMGLATLFIIMFIWMVHFWRKYVREVALTRSMLNHMVKHLERQMSHVRKKKEIEGSDLIYQVFELQKVFRNVSFDYGITMGSDRHWYVIITAGHHIKLVDGPIYKVK